MPGKKVRNDGFGNQKVSYKHGRPPKKLKKSLVAKIRRALQPQNTQVVNQGWQLAFTPGSQRAMAALGFGTAADIKNICNYAGNVTYNDGQPVTDLVLGQNGCLQVTDYNVTVDLTNQGVCLVNLRIYECVARRDVLYNDGRGNLSSMLQYGYTQQNGAGSASNQVSETSLGGTLFQNPVWCAYFRVQSVRDLQVASGSTVKVTLSHNKPYTVNPIVWDPQTDTDLIGMQAFTRCFVIEAVGKVGDGAESFTTGNVGTASVKVSGLYTVRYHWNVMPLTNSYTNTVSSSISTFNPLYIMNDAHTGVAEADNSAA